MHHLYLENMKTSDLANSRRVTVRTAVMARKVLEADDHST